VKIAVLKRAAPREGGLEKYTNRLVEAFQARGGDVCVVSFPVKSPLTFLSLAKFDRLCRSFIQENRHDLVLGMDRTSQQTHLRAGNGVHAAYLEIRRRQEGFLKGCSFSINPLHRVTLKLEKAGFENPSLRKLIVNSHFVRTQILQYYNVNPQKIEVVHNGVEWNALESAFSTKRPKMDAFQFLFIGHNFERKGLEPLLRSLARIKDTDFHLSVVGEDKHRSRFENLALILGLKNKVSFWGAQKNSAPFYQRADALVIPSLYDPFANVTVEALAMGLFVVSSEMNGGKEVIAPSAGISVSLDNLESGLREAIKHPKTQESARQIRASVEHLDFSKQLSRFCDICLSSS